MALKIVMKAYFPSELCYSKNGSVANYISISYGTLRMKNIGPDPRLKELETEF